MEEKYSWEEPYTLNDKTEPVQSFEAFKVWVEMGSSRSLKAVAERMEKSHDTIKRYSCTWKWSERLQDKLTYENRIIHGKQLQQVMTSLDIDSRRDIVTQTSMGNIMAIIHSISMVEADKLKSYYDIRTEKQVENPYLELLERLTNIYCKLENSHTKTQQKLIDYNNKCLTYQDFNDVDEYPEMLEHGQKQYSKIMSDYHNKVLGDGFKNFVAGVSLMKGKLYTPYEPNSINDLEEIESGDEPREEIEPGNTKPESISENQMKPEQ